jgi:hypothetical protein
MKDFYGNMKAVTQPIIDAKAKDSLEKMRMSNVDAKEAENISMAILKNKPKKEKEKDKKKKRGDDDEDEEDLRPPLKTIKVLSLPPYFLTRL